MMYETLQVIKQDLTQNARLEAFMFEHLKYLGEPHQESQKFISLRRYQWISFTQRIAEHNHLKLIEDNPDLKDAHCSKRGSTRLSAC